MLAEIGAQLPPRLACMKRRPADPLRVVAIWFAR